MNDGYRIWPMNRKVMLESVGGNVAEAGTHFNTALVVATKPDPPLGKPIEVVTGPCVG